MTVEFWLNSVHIPCNGLWYNDRVQTFTASRKKSAIFFLIHSHSLSPYSGNLSTVLSPWFPPMNPQVSEISDLKLFWPYTSSKFCLILFYCPHVTHTLFSVNSSSLVRSALPILATSKSFDSRDQPPFSSLQHCGLLLHSSLYLFLPLNSHSLDLSFT